MQYDTFPFEKVLYWYKNNGRHHLPWREKQTPYHVWISEIFLQQTQVSRVEAYFNKVVNAFSTVNDFAKLEYDDFFPYYEWLGYYSRARNMLKTAKIIHQKYNGIFPNTYDELVLLPWVWPYTAQAILSFWHNQNILAFDTNVEKIFSRYYFWTRFKKLSKWEKNHIQEAFQQTGFSGRDMNAALMDFSSLIDKNEISLIDFENYPLTESIFYLERWKNEIKPIKTTQKFDKNRAQIIVFLHENHKTYYSSDCDALKPFELWSSTQDHRHVIKDYFIATFWLSLSVRPAFKKLKKAGETYFLYHAQIQAWKNQFWEFVKDDYIEYLKNFF